jgi:hypothetical protein
MVQSAMRGRHLERTVWRHGWVYLAKDDKPILPTGQAISYSLAFMAPGELEFQLNRDVHWYAVDVEPGTGYAIIVTDLDQIPLAAYRLNSDYLMGGEDLTLKT